MNKVTLHNDICKRISTILRKKGYSIRNLSREHRPFDILANGKITIEVKVSNGVTNRHGTKLWSFNIHRHGFVSKSKIDLYVFRIPAIKEVGHTAGMYLVIPSPVVAGRKGVKISLRSLLMQWNKYINNWGAIKILDQTKKKEYRPAT